MHRIRRHILWATVALLGIAAPAALTLSITRLTGQHIGLAAQPLSVTRSLAPARREGEEADPAGTARHARAGHRTHASRQPAGRSGRSSDVVTPPASGGSGTSSLPQSSLPAPLAGAATASPPSQASQPARSGTTYQSGSGSHGKDDSGGDSGGGSSQPGPDD